MLYDEKSFQKKFFVISFVILSLIILRPTNINEIFYYDDNPIRFMIAKLWVEGKLTFEEKIIFFSYGSSEIFIPLFYISKKLGFENLEAVYNLSLIFYFLISLIIVSIPLKKEKDISFIFPIFCIFGIISFAKGSIHWFLSSSLFFFVLLSIKREREEENLMKIKNLSNWKNIIRFLILGLSYFISPPLYIFSIITSINMERYLKILFLSPIILVIPKFLVVFVLTISEISQALKIIKFSINEDLISKRSFITPDISVFIRPIILDYINYPLPLLVVLYISSVRAIFSDKKSTTIAVAFYSLVFISTLVLEYWMKGNYLPLPIVILSSMIFSPNPFRYLPLFLNLLIINSGERKVDKYVKFLFLILFLIRAFLPGALPQKGIPQEIKILIEYLNNKTSENSKILIEGDIHIIEKGRLIHPLYDSHIISYVVSKVDRKFYGGIIPWGIGEFSFSGGRFFSKELEESAVLKFINEKKIDYVVCWTEKCKVFFKNFGSENSIGRFSVIKLNFLSDK